VLSHGGAENLRNGIRDTPRFFACWGSQAGCRLEYSSNCRCDYAPVRNFCPEIFCTQDDFLGSKVSGGYERHSPRMGGDERRWVWLCSTSCRWCGSGWHAHRCSEQVTMCSISLLWRCEEIRDSPREYFEGETNFRKTVAEVWGGFRPRGCTFPWTIEQTMSLPWSLGTYQGAFAATEIALLRSLGNDQRGVASYRHGAPMELSKMVLGRDAGEEPESNPPAAATSGTNVFLYTGWMYSRILMWRCK